MHLPVEIIKKKKRGGQLTKAEIDFFIRGYTKGEIPDYQMSALLMAICLQDMNWQETLDLTETMLNSGVRLQPAKDAFYVDKHSTGGIGDKTSLILGPIAAAAGLRVPMISGRGLGHTGGTLDKLESIPGFQTRLDLQTFQDLTVKNGLCFIGQTNEICPADRKIYPLRDATGTVESFPLICASICSKKMAEGIHGIVFDVKYGSGAFIKEFDHAKSLAKKLITISEGFGKISSALVTDMNQPLGVFAGNSLEVSECLSILRGEDSGRRKDWSDTRDLSIELAAHMILQSDQRKSLEECRLFAVDLLASGRAYEVFEEVVFDQKGRLAELPKPQHSIQVFSSVSGFVQGFQAEKIGVLGIHLKAGRAQMSDPIDPTAGIETCVSIGDLVHKGDPLFVLHGADLDLLKSTKSEFIDCIQLGDLPHPSPPLIREVLKKKGRKNVHFI